MQDIANLQKKAWAGVACQGADINNVRPNMPNYETSLGANVLIRVHSPHRK